MLACDADERGIPRCASDELVREFLTRNVAVARSTPIKLLATTLRLETLVLRGFSPRRQSVPVIGQDDIAARCGHHTDGVHSVPTTFAMCTNRLETAQPPKKR